MNGYKQFFLNRNYQKLARNYSEIKNPCAGIAAAGGKIYKIYKISRAQRAGAFFPDNPAIFEVRL